MDSGASDSQEKEETMKKSASAGKLVKETIGNGELRKVISQLESNPGNEDVAANMITSTSDGVKKDLSIPEFIPESKMSHWPKKSSNSSENDVQPCAFDSLTSYPMRPGADDKGRDYEIRITALLALRCATLEDTHDMWIGSNVNQVGDFDDAVLCRQTHDGKSIAYLIQLKHQDKPKAIAERDFMFVAQDKKGRKKKSEDFSLAKYYKGFVEMREMLQHPSQDEPEVFTTMRKADDVRCVLFTNRSVDDKCEFLESVDDSKEWDFLNTNNKNKSIYKFNKNSLKETDTNFLSQLVLFADQIHVNSVNRQIKCELKKLTDSACGNDKNYQDAVIKFVTFIKIWTVSVIPNENDKTTSKLCHILTKRDIINKLSDILLDCFKLKHMKDDFTFADHDDAFWHKLVQDKPITIIDSDDKVLKYLRNYLGSETKRYCNEKKKTWGDHLSKITQDTFFQNSLGLNTKLLKIRDIDEEITLIHIYQCLWFNQRLPLLLNVEDAQGYDSIVKILKLSQFDLRVIILKNNNIKLKIKEEDLITHFVSLGDLNEANRDQILSLPVKLQGRSLVKFGDLVDSSMVKHVKCRDIIYILLKDFNIGHEYEPLPEHFVSRSLFKILIRFQVLEIDREIFLVKDEGSCGVLANKLKGLHLDKNLNINIFICGEITQLQIKRLKAKRKPIHRLAFDGHDWLEWKESFGSTTSILSHQYNPQQPFCYDLDDLIKANNILNNVRLISASPGMGKSMLLDFISLRASTTVWILKIALNDHNEYFEDVRHGKTTNYIKYFNNTTLNKYNCTNVDVAQAIFQKMLKAKQVQVLMDAFDEISICYKEEVTRIVKRLHQQGCQIWITTRAHIKWHLEKEFSTISITLKPFTKDDQENFMIKYFNHYIGDSIVKTRQALIKEFVLKLLVASRTNLDDRDGEFTGIPLQTKLLCGVFIKELQLSIKEGVVRLRGHFDLLYLYEEFTKRKNKILCEKVGKYAAQTQEFFSTHQKLLALQIMFDKDDLSELNIDQQLELYFENNKNEMDILQTEGIVVVEHNNPEAGQKFHIRFVHRTFTEYKAAQWLSENFNSPIDRIKVVAKNLFNYRFNSPDDYSFLFRMFDCILAKGFPLFTMILNGQISEAHALIEAAPNNMDKDSTGERTVVHMVALSSNKKEAVDFFKYIPDTKLSVVSKSDIFDYNPLDYALSRGSLTVANKLCEKLKHIALNINSEKLSFHLDECVNNDLKALFQKVVQYMVLFGLLEKSVREETTIAELLIDKYQIKEKVICKTMDKLESNATASQLLEKLNIKVPGERYYHDLIFAVVFGTEKNVWQLLRQGADINKQSSGYCPLHCAVIHKQDTNLNVLLAEGAKVNIPNYRRHTPLHIACDSGYENTILKLLSAGADIDKPDEDGNTPLFVSLIRGHITTANLLLSKGASVNTENRHGYSMLHLAAMMGQDDILLNLIRAGLDIDKRNFLGDTPLFLALRKRHLNTAKLLLVNNADVKIENENGETCLHLAAQAGLDDVLQGLLIGTPGLDRQDGKGNTPLFYALQGGHLSTTNLLLSKQDGFDIKNSDGNTYLHLAAGKGHDNVLLELIGKGLDINEQNNRGESPITDAIEGKHIHTVELLLSKGAHIDIKDNDGNSVLHNAASAGCLAVLEKLSSTISEINMKNDLGQTPLYFSVFQADFEDDLDLENHIETVKFLLANGADASMQDKNGNTVLHCLFIDVERKYDEPIVLFSTPLKQNFQEKVTRILLNKGVDVKLQNKEGKTALDLAVYEDCTNCIALIQSHSTV